MTQYPIVVVRAIIQNQNNEVLFIKRDNSIHDYGYWCLPGGKVDFGDSVEYSLIKEIKEETSLECISNRFLFYMDSLPTESFQEHYITFYFECQVTGDINLNEESSEFVWIGSDKIEQYDIVFLNDVALKKYWEMDE